MKLTFLKNLMLVGLCFAIGPVPTVFADAAPASGGSSALMNGLMLGGLALIFYFMILRPQSKRAKEQKTLMDSLQKGDEVLTVGGLGGKIAKVEEDFCLITVAPGVEVIMQKQAIAHVLPKNTLKDLHKAL